MCNKTLVMARVEECFQIASRAYNHEFRFPSIRFDKSGTVAGTANGYKWELNFNETLLNENMDHFVKQTVAHEVAHLIDHEVYGLNNPKFNIYGQRKKRAPHGRNWKIIMMTLGVPAERCHNYNVSNVKRKRKTSKTYTYYCAGCKRNLQMGAIRHRNQSSGVRTYSHCRGYQIIFQG